METRLKEAAVSVKDLLPSFSSTPAEEPPCSETPKKKKKKKKEAEVEEEDCVVKKKKKRKQTGGESDSAASPLQQNGSSEPEPVKVKQKKKKKKQREGNGEEEEALDWIMFSNVGLNPVCHEWETREWGFIFQNICILYVRKPQLNLFILLLIKKHSEAVTETKTNCR